MQYVGIKSLCWTKYDGVFGLLRIWPPGQHLTLLIPLHCRARRAKFEACGVLKGLRDKNHSWRADWLTRESEGKVLTLRVKPK